MRKFFIILLLSGAALAGEVEVPNGALLLPEGEGPWPAAVIVHGSGPADRHHAWAREMAGLFVERGVAVLVPDKRANWQLAGFDDLAADAIAAVEHLRTREDIDANRVGVIGLSQGGWIVPVVGARRYDIAFVVDLSGATVSFAEQSFLEMRNTARKAGVSPGDINVIVELNRRAGAYAMGGSWEEYGFFRSKALALDGAAKKIVLGFPETRDAPIWTFLRKVAAFDPIPYWMVVDQPVFLALGEKDEDDNVPVRESVRRLENAFASARKKNYEIVVVPGSGHSLRDANGKPAPQLVSALTRWLEKYVPAEGNP